MKFSTTTSSILCVTMALSPSLTAAVPTGMDAPTSPNPAGSPNIRQFPSSPVFDGEPSGSPLMKHAPASRTGPGSPRRSIPSRLIRSHKRDGPLDTVISPIAEMVKQTTTFAKPVTSVVQPISSPVLEKLSTIPIVGSTVAKLGTASGLGISNLDAASPPTASQPVGQLSAASSDPTDSATPSEEPVDGSSDSLSPSDGSSTSDDPSSSETPSTEVTSSPEDPSSSAALSPSEEPSSSEDPSPSGYPSPSEDPSPSDSAPESLGDLDGSLHHISKHGFPSLAQIIGEIPGALVIAFPSGEVDLVAYDKSGDAHAGHGSKDSEPDSPSPAAPPPSPASSPASPDHKGDGNDIL